LIALFVLLALCIILCVMMVTMHFYHKKKNSILPSTSYDSSDTSPRKLGRLNTPNLSTIISDSLEEDAKLAIKRKKGANAKANVNTNVDSLNTPNPSTKSSGKSPQKVDRHIEESELDLSKAVSRRSSRLTPLSSKLGSPSNVNLRNSPLSSLNSSDVSDKESSAIKETIPPVPSMMKLTSFSAHDVDDSEDDDVIAPLDREIVQQKVVMALASSKNISSRAGELSLDINSANSLEALDVENAGSRRHSDGRS